MPLLLLNPQQLFFLAHRILLFTWAPQAQQLLVMILVQVFMRTLVWFEFIHGIRLASYVTHPNIFSKHSAAWGFKVCHFCQLK
jgi:hypothetical protein